MGMEQFTPYCREMLSDRASQHSVKKLVSSMISHYMLPHWSERQIDMRIDRLSHLHKENPIKVLIFLFYQIFRFTHSLTVFLIYWIDKEQCFIPLI